MAEIKHYAIRIHGGIQGSGKGIRAQIHLFGEQNKLVGRVDFIDEGHTLLPDTKGDMIQLSLPASQLSVVVDILRNEGPVYIEWQESIKNAYLGTGQEPVGEGE